MKFRALVLAILLTLLVSTIVLATPASGATSASPKITLSTNTLTVTVGTCPPKPITYTLNFSKSLCVFRWTSSAPKVATISSNGTVSGNAPGTAVLTLTAWRPSGTVKAQCVVTVVRPLSDLRLYCLKPGAKVYGRCTDGTIELSDTESRPFQFLVSASDPGKLPQIAEKVTGWTSSDPGVASINSSGSVTVARAGTTVIAAKTPSGSLSCRIKVWYRWPVPGYKRVSQEWGVPNGGVIHRGIDISAIEGTPIYAATGGKIIVKEYYGASDASLTNGNWLLVQNNDGRYAFYGHLQRFGEDVEKAGKDWGKVVVTEETILGYVGKTGDQKKITGSHLHFIVCTSPKYWIDSNTLNPRDFIKEPSK